MAARSTRRRSIAGAYVSRITHTCTHGYSINLNCTSQWNSSKHFVWSSPRQCQSLEMILYPITKYVWQYCKSGLCVGVFGSVTMRCTYISICWFVLWHCQLVISSVVYLKSGSTAAECMCTCASEKKIFFFFLMKMGTRLCNTKSERAHEQLQVTLRSFPCGRTLSRESVKMYTRTVNLQTSASTKHWQSHTHFSSYNHTPIPTDRDQSGEVLKRTSGVASLPALLNQTSLHGQQTVWCVYVYVCRRYRMT